METLPNQMPGQFNLPGGFEASPESKFDFWGVLNRRKWIVFLGMLTGIGIGVLYYYYTPVIYQSEASIRIEPKSPNYIRLSRLSSEAVAPDIEQILPTRHDKIINQPLIIQKCFKTNDLYRLSSFEEMSQEDVIKMVEKALEISPDKEEDFNYKLSFECKNPDDAKIVLSNMIQTYESYLEERFSNESEELVSLLKEMKMQFDTNYRSLREQLEQVRREDNSPMLANGMDIHSHQLSILSERIKAHQDELRELVGTRDRGRQALELGPTAAQEELWVLQQQKLLELETNVETAARFTQNEQMIREMTLLEIELAELKQRLGSNHPDVRRKSASVEMYRKMVEERQASADALASASKIKIDPLEILNRFVGAVDQKITDLNSKLEKDLNDYEVHRKEAERLTVVRTRKADLEKDLAYVETLINETKDKIFEVDPKGQLAELSRQEGFNFVRLQDATDGERVWPILPIVLAIGGLLGSLAGFGLGTLVDFADKTFHNPDEIIRNLNLPLIGHIPVISQGKRYQLANSKIAPTICVFHRPKSQNAEAFRAVRTALYFNTQGQEHSVIQVTSPTPGDGKSTIVSNLAVSIAQSGKKTLLIDADMRRPRQHLNFGLENPSEGMSTVLSGESFWKDCVMQVPEIEGLFMLPCGPKPSNPSELCTSSQLTVLFEQMKQEFDFILIDTPPVLAVTDPCPIGARVDGVILALRIRKNIRVSAQRATDILRNVGANVIGTVVNGVGSQPGYGSRYADVAYRAGYWYSKYGYGYGYGYGKYYDDKKADKKQLEQINKLPAPALAEKPTDQSQD